VRPKSAFFAYTVQIDLQHLLFHPRRVFSLLRIPDSGEFRWY
jgi:hypothetical protein